MKKILVVEVYIQDDDHLHVDILKDFSYLDKMDKAYRAAFQILEKTKHMNKPDKSN